MQLPSSYGKILIGHQVVLILSNKSKLMGIRALAKELWSSVENTSSCSLTSWSFFTLRCVLDSIDVWRSQPHFTFVVRSVVSYADEYSMYICERYKPFCVTNKGFYFYTLIHWSTDLNYCITCIMGGIYTKTTCEWNTYGNTE